MGVATSKEGVATSKELVHSGWLHLNILYTGMATSKELVHGVTTSKELVHWVDYILKTCTQWGGHI